MRTKQALSDRLRGLAIISFCILAAGPGMRGAEQGTNAVPDRYPLQPADTSSPRDTLRSFLANVNKVAAAWGRQTPGGTIEHAWMNALMTLDFSTTPDSDSWSVQTERMALLKEILDRVEIPADNEIPGDAEVSKGAVARWIIPNTSITIARIEHGPRVGEFLFSADSVERLFQTYALAKELPYKPSASNTGIYEAFKAADGTSLTFEERLRARLRRVDTSSPRSTLRTFLENMDRAYALVKEAEAALKARPPTMTRQLALQNEQAANNLLLQATATLDLSLIPEAHRKAASIESVLELKEILDRTLLPKLENVPDFAAVLAARREQGQSSSSAAGPFRWRYPNTDIEIVEILQGERQGEFLFSDRTVRQISGFYERVRPLPYRTELGPARESKYAWSKVSEGFYEYYISNPGYLVPRASFLGRLVGALPAWFRTMHGGLTAWQWIGLLLCTLALVLSARAVLLVLRRLARRLNPPLDGWLMILAPTLILFVIIAVKSFVGEGLNITGQLRTVITSTLKAAGIVVLIWGVTRLCKAIAETVIASPKIRDRSLDASLLRIAMHIAALVIGGWIFIVSARDLGADLLPLLAGLGVGGLAVALAAQRTLANFIGSLILFANKPVKPGDFCRYGDQIGTVEQIGLLSTRIRSLERTIVTVPNAEFSEIKLENFAVRDRRLLKTVLQLRYETTPEQMRYILAKLRELLLGHPKVSPDPARVRFVGYGAYSKDVEIFAYLLCQDQDTFLAIQEDVLLRIEDIVNEAGSGFAFPSQTAYLLRDKGLDAKRGNQAEARVRQWREVGKFPFPEFSKQEREQLKDTLDYPPKGSPDYEPLAGWFDRQVPAGPSSFSVDDFINLPSFAAKLQERNQVADFLWGRLAVKTQKLLAEYSSEVDAELREALLRDLDAIIQGPAIYAVDRFSEVKRRPETEDLLKSNPQGEDLARLNRMLLEDAFPQELARKVTLVSSSPEEAAH